MRVCALSSGPRTATKMSLGLVDERRMAALLEKPEVVEVGRLEEDSHADTTYVGKGFKVVTEHDYTATVSGFSDGIGTMSLPVVDAVTVAKTADGMEVMLQFNQALYKADEERSLLSTFQARWSGTRVDSVPMSHDPTSLFGIVIEDEDLGKAVVPFNIDRASCGFNCRTPTDEDWETLPLFEITSRLRWDPNDPKHAEEEAKVQALRDFTAKDRLMMTAEVPRDGEAHRVNLSAVWTRSTDAMLAPLMDQVSDAVSDTTEDEWSSSDSASDSKSDGSSDSGRSTDNAGAGYGEKRRQLKKLKANAKIDKLKSRLSKLRLSKLKSTKESLKNRSVEKVHSSSRKPRVNAERLAKM